MVEAFTPGGKTCFAPLKAQIELCLPTATASQSLATLLDPVRMIFAKKLLGDLIYKEIVALLGKEHLKVSKAIHIKIIESGGDVTTATQNTEPTEEEEILAQSKDMDSSDSKELNFVCLLYL